MAIGQRTAGDLMVEMSNHLLDIYIDLPLQRSVFPGSPSSLQVFSTAALYPGAQVVVGWQSGLATTEVVTVTTVLSQFTFQANVLNFHHSGEVVFGATFPDQQPTDPVFTQAEILGYIAQAQNEFLTRVPVIFGLFGGAAGGVEVTVGQPVQTLPSTVIELERVAIQSIAQSVPIASLYRQGGIVNAIVAVDVTQPPYNFTPGLPILVDGVTDSSFNSTSGQTFPLLSVSLLDVGGFGSGGFGAFGFGSGPTSGAGSGSAITWAQAGPDTSVLLGGSIDIPRWTRLYEGSQSQLSLNNPYWQAAATGLPPTLWYEDRTGILGWGVAPFPMGNYWVELLASVRGGESLNLLSPFLLPDIFVPYVKYKALEYCWTKAGVQRSPGMARICKGRFEFGVMLADRFLRAVFQKAGATAGTAAAAGGIF